MYKRWFFLYKLGNAKQLATFPEEYDQRDGRLLFCGCWHNFSVGDCVIAATCMCVQEWGWGGGFVCRDLCMCMLVMWNHDDVMHRNVDIATWTMVVYNHNCIGAVPFCPPIRCRTVWREAGPVPMLHGRGAVLLHVSEVQRTVWRLHWWGWWIRM